MFPLLCSSIDLSLRLLNMTLAARYPQAPVSANGSNRSSLRISTWALGSETQLGGFGPIRYLSLAGTVCLRSGEEEGTRETTSHDARLLGGDSSRCAESLRAAVDVASWPHATDGFQPGPIGRF